MIVRKLLIGVAAVLALVVAAGVFIPLAVPVGVYRARVEALVKEATGRDLIIAGPIRLSVLPALAVEARNVYFAKLPGARSPDMAAVKQLRIELKFRPLLHRLIVVRRLDLVRPVIALEVDKTGRPNWVFGPAANSAAPPGGMPASGKIRGGLDISGLSLPKVRLSDGKISYFDQRTGKTEELDGIDATFSLHSLGKAFAGDGSAVWNGEQVTFAVNIANPLGLFDGAESEVGVKLAAAPATLDFSGRVAGSPSLRLDGSLGVESKSLRRFARWAGSPIALDGEGLGPLTVKGTVAIAGTATSLTDAAISLDAIKAKGSVSINSAGLRPALSGKLDIDRLDLNPYLAAAAAATVLPPAAGSASPAPATSGRDGMPIDLSALKLADADFDLTLGSIAFGQIQIGASAGKIRVKDGRFTAELSRMALYRGNGRGKLTVDGNGTVPSIGLDATLAGVQIQPLAQAAIGNGRLTGSGDLDIAVTARGDSRRGLIDTLSGRGALHLAKGQIQGVNLPALADSAAKIGHDLLGSLNVTGALDLLARGRIDQAGPLALLSDAAKSLTGGGNVTGFSTLSASCTVANGLVRNDDLRLQLGAIPMTGAGTVDLRTQRVDYRIKVQLAGGVAVPIQVSGTLNNLSYRPDLAAMLTQTPGNVGAILKSAGTSVGRNIEGVGQTLRDVGKGVGQSAVGVLNGIFGK